MPTPSSKHHRTGALDPKKKRHHRTGALDPTQEFRNRLSMISSSHPWHGVSPGANAPSVVECFIEMTPNSPVKLELDKQTGILRVDRPQVFSSLCPTPYGFIPQTYCGPQVAELCMQATGRRRMVGDGDPLDICVLTDCELPLPGLILRVIPIGGMRMIDKGEADDKIIAVLDQDLSYGKVKNISEIPEEKLKKLRHYFISYKRPPEEKSSRRVTIAETYGRDEAHRVIEASMRDYHDKFGSPEENLEALRQLLAAALERGFPVPAGGKR